MRMTISLILVLLGALVPAAWAGVGPAPDAAEPSASCTQLDEEIGLLLAQTYAERPAFYDDPRNAIAGAAGIVLTEFAFLYWVYSEAKRSGVHNRIVALQRRIETLRQAKARQHCFEDR